MKKLLLFIIISIQVGVAQQFNSVFNQILQHNQELKAIRALNQTRVLSAKDKLIPANPEFQQEFKENNNYEIGLTQRFQFPTFYYHQYKKLKLTQKQQRILYKATRQRLLETAKIFIYKYGYLTQQIELLKNRFAKATQRHQFFETLLAEGEISQLAFNQSAIHKVKYENQLSDLKQQLVAVSQKLTVLNGGKQLDLDNFAKSVDLNLVNTQNLKQRYLTQNPQFQLQQVNQQLAHKNTTITKYKWLPDFRIGVHKEKESDPMLHYGISIPLWKNKNRVDRAQAAQNYHTANKQFTKQSVISKIDQLLAQYELVKKQHHTNLRLKKQLNSKKLLEKRLKTEEISIIEFFNELEKLYAFEDELAKTKLDLQILIVKMTSFQL